MAEAYRLLKPGGQLWVTEMDFTTEGFRKLRANPLLFSLIRATEPYLDVYADYQEELPSDLETRKVDEALWRAAMTAHKDTEGKVRGGTAYFDFLNMLRISGNAGDETSPSQKQLAAAAAARP